MRWITMTTVGLFLTTAAAHAAIIPSWRINPITPEALTAAPELAGGLSVSLMVELTDTSVFNQAGLDLTTAFGGVQPVYYQNAFGSDNNRPSPGLLPLFPQLAFDTHVRTTGNNGAATQPLNGTGLVQIGRNGVLDVLWTAVPNTEESGEIARLTFLEGNDVRPVTGVLTSLNGPGTTPLQGFVADQSAVRIGLPPIPVGFVPIPEPASAACLALMCLAGRRNRVGGAR